VIWMRELVLVIVPVGVPRGRMVLGGLFERDYVLEYRSKTAINVCDLIIKCSTLPSPQPVQCSQSGDGWT
jgi:hypothetical protein